MCLNNIQQVVLQPSRIICCQPKNRIEHPRLVSPPSMCYIKHIILKLVSIYKSVSCIGYKHIQ